MAITITMTNDSGDKQLEVTYDRTTGAITEKINNNNCDIHDYDIRSIRFATAKILKDYSTILSNSSATNPDYDNATITQEDLNI